jgi:nicotinamidase-related amidase
MSADPSGTALIIVDLQNDVVGPGGKLAAGGAADYAKRHDVIGNVARLATAARSAGIPVVHVHNVHAAGHRDVSQNAPLFRNVVAQAALEAGTQGSRPMEGVTPATGDIVLLKERMNAFYGTGLDVKLRGLAVTRVVVCGAWTNFSIEHTCRHAADAGYEVVVVVDGTATLNEEWQRAALDFALTDIAQKARVAELVAEWTGR